MKKYKLPEKVNEILVTDNGHVFIIMKLLIKTDDNNWQVVEKTLELKEQK